LDSNGVAGNNPLPVLDGTININGYVYEDTVNTLESTFDNLTINPKGYAVRF